MLDALNVGFTPTLPGVLCGLLMYPPVREEARCPALSELFVWLLAACDAELEELDIRSVADFGLMFTTV